MRLVWPHTHIYTRNIVAYEMFSDSNEEEKQDSKLSIKLCKHCDIRFVHNLKGFQSFLTDQFSIETTFEQPNPLNRFVYMTYRTYILTPAYVGVS